MQRRLKLGVHTMVLDIGVEYFGFSRVTLIDTTGKNRKAYLYKCEKLTDEQKTRILGYSNTDLKCVKSEYAPELVRDAVLIFDQCIR